MNTRSRMDTKSALLLLFLSASSLHVTNGQSLDGCDDTKGCLRPRECSDEDCPAYVTWEPLANGQTRFAMRAPARGYVAFGLQRTNATGMSPAEVYACTINNEVRRSENIITDEGRWNSEAREIPGNTVSVESVSSENCVITCEFTRQASLEGDNTFYDISAGNRYFIMLAVGEEISTEGVSNGSIQSSIHEDRWKSSAAHDLTDIRPVVAKSDVLARAHAGLMVIAWLGFASIGITLARYFKPMWPSSTLLGQKVWFTIHRLCMVSSVLCCTVAFILIFVHVGGFVDTSIPNVTVHAVFGIIVTCLGIINPIMAIFRPHPGTPKRPIFNWAHWGVGILAYLMALVTAFLGFGYPFSLLSRFPRYVFFIMVAFVGFHFLMWILLEVQRRMMDSQAVNPAPPKQDDVGPNNPDESAESVNIAMKARGDPASQEQTDAGPAPPVGSRAKTILLGIYVFGVVTLVVIMVVVIIATLRY